MPLPKSRLQLIAAFRPIVVGLFAGCLIADAAAIPAATLAVPPVAPVREVTETLHGVAVRDPYRYFENIKRAGCRTAGGIFVGRAVTSAPELFAAAIFNVGVLDAVRAEESANGITNISEFGSAKNPAEFPALLEMSTYHNVRDNTAYPAVMLVHGMNDPRVDVWHSAKTAARLHAASASGKPILLRLDMQAGHGIGSTATQRYALSADIFSFLLWQMGKAALKDGMR